MAAEYENGLSAWYQTCNFDFTCDRNPYDNAGYAFSDSIWGRQPLYGMWYGPESQSTSLARNSTALPWMFSKSRIVGLTLLEERIRSLFAFLRSIVKGSCPMR
jgi:hypothetical protein